ncbi:MAG: hypothetical protein C4297_09740 [Gemmataceae bacterium]
MTILRYILWLILLALVGCSSKESSTAPDTPAKQKVDNQPPQSIIGKTRETQMRLVSQNNLRNIGIAYMIAAQTGPVMGPADLGSDVKLVCPRDNQPYEIIWGVDVTRLPSGGRHLLLAWEKTPDADGGRCVLMADCTTVSYMTAQEFATAPRAQGRR